MLLFWKWKELYCGTSLDQFSAIRAALEDNDIKYNYKLKKHDDSPPFRGPARDIVGRVGENPAAATMYYLYVYKSDYEKARYVSRGAK